MNWSVEVLRLAAKELEAMPDDVKASFLSIASQLTLRGPSGVGMPHVRHLQKALWEMRMKGRDGIARAIYFTASGSRIVVVRAFAKKTQTTPSGELKLAAKRMREWIDAQDS
jgi:phage-related protein